MHTTIHLTNLTLPCRVGVNDLERHIRQRVAFSVEVLLAAAEIPATLEQSFDYNTLADFIRTLSLTHHDLVEDYARKIVGYCLAHPLTAQVTVQIDKLEAVKNAERVGCHVVAGR